jgi:hypothetical protein
VESTSKWFVNTVYEGVCVVVASHVSGVDSEGLLLILNVMSFLEWLSGIFSNSEKCVQKF